MSAQKYKLIGLFGKSGSGKDTLLQKVLQAYPAMFNRVVNTTTRKPRVGEEQGKTYFYVDNDEFTRQVLEGEMYTFHQYGNGTWYGLSERAFSKDKINIGPLSVAQVKHLIENYSDEIKLVPLYIDCDDKIRLLRALNREEDPDCYEICRRFISDTEDYKVIDFIYYSRMNQNKQDLEKNIKIIYELGEFLQKDI